jgi:hypothetical protein
MMSIASGRSPLYVAKPKGGRVSLRRKLLGIPTEPRDGQETFATTNYQGYTVLDTEKLLASEKFQKTTDRLKAFAADNKLGSVNGAKPANIPVQAQPKTGT